MHYTWAVLKREHALYTGVHIYDKIQYSKMFIIQLRFNQTQLQIRFEHLLEKNNGSIGNYVDAFETEDNRKHSPGDGKESLVISHPFSMSLE